MEHNFLQLILFAQDNNLIFLLLVVCIFFVVFLVVMILLGWKKDAPVKAKAVVQASMIDQDIDAIAGDDYVVTQLDLARAYIELGKQSMAKEILQQVLAMGDASQQEIARELLAPL